jgi:hypothetical protein
VNVTLVPSDMLRFLAAVPFLLVAGPSTSQPDKSAIFCVLELFTSQGCSSCPAADRLLGAMARKPDVVALSLPVDYWDYIGWKDTLASPLSTKRQKAYAAMLGSRQVYTPETVVNGLSEAIGSDGDAIQRAIEATRGRDDALTLRVR